MKHSYLALTLGTIITTVFLFSACKKINESTELGGGLIPPIDNINTFDTTINDILVFNDTFGLANDSQRLAKNQEFFLGRINSADPFFGRTDARIFMEYKSTIYGAYPFPRKDSVKIDSIVLVMDYAETYGDTLAPQLINVYELDPLAPANKFNSDSSYLIRKNDFVYTNLLGSRTVTPRELDDSVKAFRDTTKNQLRIRLDTNFARRLLNYDTSNAYRSDSAFKTYFKGFAVQSMSSGNAVMGFGFGTNNSKLAIYYNYPRTTTPTRDTAVSYFFFTDVSAAANYVIRDYTGTPVAAAVGGAASDPFAYIQTTPGTFATLKIPSLKTLNNRVIHRAELIMEQAYHTSDTVFYPPEFLYLDAYDSSISKFRTVPYDLLVDGAGTMNLGTFGVAPISTRDAAGNSIKIWKFNISRYVQHVLNGTVPLYDLRLSAPFIVRNQYGFPPGEGDPRLISINPSIVKGRIRLVGGGLAQGPQRMRLRIIYSKL